ncbi:MAG: glycoside hydrolase family 13 protein [Bacilli bacterium]|nr:glycoside hydrolase family 13 protein [Bacilli bacterium]
MQGSLDKVEFNIFEIEKNDNKVKYNVRIKVPESFGWIERMKFITEANGIRSAYQLKHEKNEDGFVYFSGEVFLNTCAIYNYYFSFEANKNFMYFKKENKTGNQSVSNVEKWKLSVNFDVPNWAKGKIMYHIFVDRFNRDETVKLEKLPRRDIHKSWNEEMTIGPNKEGIWNADFYGGNLKGVINKLKYIKDLGVSILYLSPVVSSQSNHRYDASDYEIVDPYLGNNNDLKELCDKAHEMGIKVVLDAVFNHTGNDSKYFNEYSSFPNLGAYQSKDSKYYPFFRKREYDGKVEFDYWWGMKNLPVCDGYSKEWQNYIYGENGVIDKWFRLGIDGLRLDVADELTDEFIEGIRTAVKRNKEDGFIIGEVWKNPMRMGRSYISSGKGMDSVMNYLLVDALIRYYKYQDVNKLREVLNEIQGEYPEGTIESLMNFTSTHDISRALNIFGSDSFQKHGEWAWNTITEDRTWQKNYNLSPLELKKGKEIYKSYLFSLTFLPGILSIFYGDEIGLTGMGNLYNRKTFTWDNIDYDLLNYFKEIGKIRNKETFLEDAMLNIIDINDKLFMFERKNDVDAALIVVNRSSDQEKLIVPKKYENIEPIYRLNNSNQKEMDSYGGVVLKKVRK